MNKLPSQLETSEHLVARLQSFSIPAELAARPDFFGSSMQRYQEHLAEWILRDCGATDEEITDILQATGDELAGQMSEQALEQWAAQQLATLTSQERETPCR